MISIATDKLARYGTFAIERPAGSKLVIVYDKGTHLELQYTKPKLGLFSPPIEFHPKVKEIVYGYQGLAPEPIRQLGIVFVNRAAGLNWYVRR